MENSARPSVARIHTIPDHEGNDVNLAWLPTQDGKYSGEQPPPFPFQVYFTKGAEAVANNLNFASALVHIIEELGHWPGRHRNIHARFELYSKCFPNILACIAHQRKEILHRNRNAVYPRLLSKWGHPEDDYQGRIIVIDRDDCLSTGVILVGFDPGRYQRGRQLEQWYQATDIPAVESFRLPTWGVRSDIDLRSRLGDQWFRSGGTWTEDDLARRNEGAASPALYPAVDPDSHYDVEHEVVHELDGTALPPPVVDADSEDGDSDNESLKIPECFDKNELFLTDADLPHLDSETYTDLLDQAVTSVWDRRLSKTRPAFSFTLYVGYDVLPLRPKALFTCLNKGLLAGSRWTLDVVTNMPSLEATFDYHARSAFQRTSARLARLRSCTKMVLHKVSNGRLPVELLDHIEDMLVPLEVPNYSSRPLRPHQDVFLYLDGSHLSTGPLIVYSNQAPFWLNEQLPGLKQTLRHELTSEDTPLCVLFLRFWHRVADELHVLWSLCSPRLAINESETPTISLKLHMPKLCFLQSSNPYRGDDFEDETLLNATFSLRSDFHEPITLHTKSLLSHDIRNEALDLIDRDTGQILPQIACAHVQRSKGDSWLQSRELGFPKTWTPEPECMQTLYPGQWTAMPNVDDNGWPRRITEWLRNRLDAGVLKDGGRYALRLKEGVLIPRWTYGISNQRKGPYNLPPLPVKMAEGQDEVHFDFEWRGGSQ